MYQKYIRNIIVKNNLSQINLYVFKYRCDIGDLVIDKEITQKKIEKAKELLPNLTNREIINQIKKEFGSSLSFSTITELRSEQLDNAIKIISDFVKTWIEINPDTSEFLKKPLLIIEKLK